MRARSISICLGIGVFWKWIPNEAVFNPNGSGDSESISIMNIYHNKIEPLADSGQLGWAGSDLANWLRNYRGIGTGIGLGDNGVVVVTGFTRRFFGSIRIDETVLEHILMRGRTSCCGPEVVGGHEDLFYLYGCLSNEAISPHCELFIGFCRVGS